jgi:hypothetical protein
MGGWYGVAGGGSWVGLEADEVAVVGDVADDFVF